MSKEIEVKVPYSLRGSRLRDDMTVLDRLNELELLITKGIWQPKSVHNEQFDSWCEEFEVLGRYMICHPDA